MLIHWWLQYWWAACLCSNWLKYLKVVRIWILICIKGAQMRHFYIYWTGRLAIWCNRSFSNVVHRQWYSKKKKKKKRWFGITPCPNWMQREWASPTKSAGFHCFIPSPINVSFTPWILRASLQHLEMTSFVCLSILVFRSIFSWNCTKINIISRNLTNKCD